MTVALSLSGVIVSVAALNASTGLDAWWLPAWVAPVGVLAAAFRSRWRSAAALSFGVFLFGAVRLIPYLASVAPIAVVLGFLAVRALACDLLAARDRLVRGVHVVRAHWQRNEYG